MKHALHTRTHYLTAIFHTNPGYLVLPLLPYAQNCIRLFFLALSVTFLRVWNISGTTEQICTKFTGKTCLVVCSDEFECQGHQGQRMAFFGPFSVLLAVYVCQKIFSLSSSSFTCSRREPSGISSTDFYSRSPFVSSNQRYQIGLASSI